MKRLIPALLLENNTLHKTKKFSNYKYVGDPVNTLRVFSEKGADEAFIIDKSAYCNGINLELLSEIAANSFMPLTYAGSVSCVEDAKKIISCGIERIAVGVYSQLNVCLVDEISTYLGKSGVCSILNIATYGKFQLLYDYKKRRPRFRYKLSEAVRDLNNSSTGEVILVDVMNEGTRSGFSLQCLMPLFRKDIPLMAYGGISSYDEVDALWSSGFTGVAASALLTLRPPFDSVMISYPDFKTRCRVQNLTQPQISIDRYDKLV